jgi:hypothetical protein
MLPSQATSLVIARFAGLKVSTPLNAKLFSQVHLSINEVTLLTVVVAEWNFRKDFVNFLLSTKSNVL